MTYDINKYLNTDWIKIQTKKLRTLKNERLTSTKLNSRAVNQSFVFIFEIFGFFSKARLTYSFGNAVWCYKVLFFICCEPECFYFSTVWITTFSIVAWLVNKQKTPLIQINPKISNNLFFISNNPLWLFTYWLKK